MNKQKKAKYIEVITANCKTQINLTFNKCGHKKIVPITYGTYHVYFPILHILGGKAKL